MGTESSRPFRYLLYILQQKEIVFTFRTSVKDDGKFSIFTDRRPFSMKRVYGSRRSVMRPIDEDVDSPDKSRERRRRRIEMRRRLALVSPVAGTGTDNLDAPKSPAVELVNENAEPSASNKETPVSSPAPLYGSISVVGRARDMEDEISVQPNFCRPEINGYRPVHFFGVFDGHGGHHVSALCKENMHVIMEEELMRVRTTGDKSTGEDVEELWRTSINRSFERMDEMAMALCQCNGIENSKMCRFHPQLSLVGSTAVVLLLTDEFIIVANCGDSRAVLSRSGKAVPLSFDHKSDREDERERIEASGGRILFAGNGARVEGVLAMSRAIGDRFLKQVVISEPEYTFTRRESEDMSLILASDGLWDVLSSELSCEVVRKCQQEDEKCKMGMVAQRAAGGGGGGGGGGQVYASRSATASAAALLVRLAMGRRSNDNISVIVVDLRKGESKKERVNSVG
ncbi:probable protein phosphatase 2C 75 [Lactuca sativa]|nr:probable protein phosphatase 2C 75 [Lactuca sativa]